VYLAHGNLGERNITRSIQSWVGHCMDTHQQRLVEHLATDAVKMQFVTALRAAVSHELTVTLQFDSKSL
jgi:hypothetical protein